MSPPVRHTVRGELAARLGLAIATVALASAGSWP